MMSSPRARTRAPRTAHRRTAVIARSAAGPAVVVLPLLLALAAPTARSAEVAPPSPLPPPRDLTLPQPATPANTTKAGLETADICRHHDATTCPGDPKCVWTVVYGTAPGAPTPGFCARRLTDEEVARIGPPQLPRLANPPDTR